jgi:hypothetical protein
VIFTTNGRRVPKISQFYYFYASSPRQIERASQLWWAIGPRFNEKTYDNEIEGKRPEARWPTGEKRTSEVRTMPEHGEKYFTNDDFRGQLALE